MNNLQFARDLGVKTRRADAQIKNQDDFAARIHVISGQFNVQGAGELVKDIAFPVTFVEKPLLAFGGALDDNQAIVAGNFPTISVVVLKYKEGVSQAASSSFSGASLIVVVTGVEDQSVWVHWSFTGMALVNPIGNTL